MNRAVIYWKAINKIWESIIIAFFTDVLTFIYMFVSLTLKTDIKMCAPLGSDRHFIGGAIKNLTVKKLEHAIESPCAFLKAPFFV